jgi:hydrogenase nickel incorporation protein HypB
MSGKDTAMSDRTFEILETKERVIADNDAEASKVRKLLEEHKIFLVNLMASQALGKLQHLYVL